MSKQIPQWTFDGRAYSVEYRTWQLQVWRVADGRWLFFCDLIVNGDNDSEMLKMRGYRASFAEAKAAAIAMIDHRGGEVMS